MSSLDEHKRLLRLLASGAEPTVPPPIRRRSEINPYHLSTATSFGRKARLSIAGRGAYHVEEQQQPLSTATSWSQRTRKSIKRRADDFLNRLVRSPSECKSQANKYPHNYASACGFSAFSLTHVSRCRIVQCAICTGSSHYIPFFWRPPSARNHDICVCLLCVWNRYSISIKFETRAQGGGIISF